MINVSESFLPSEMAAYFALTQIAPRPSEVRLLLRLYPRYRAAMARGSGRTRQEADTNDVEGVKAIFSSLGQRTK